MNSIIINVVEEISHNQFIINDLDQLNHIHNILKSKVGNHLKLNLINKGFTQGEIISLKQDEIILKLTNTPIQKGKIQWFDLIVGVSRPQTCKKILEHATTMGAKSFHFFSSDLSEKSYLDSKLFTEKKYLYHIKHGLSQSSTYSRWPELTLSRKTDGKIIEKNKQQFILSPFASQSFSTIDLDFSSPLTIAIGPERGWTKKEICHFKQKGFTEIKVSSSTLRVENATISALAQLELRRGLI